MKEHYEVGWIILDLHAEKPNEINGQAEENKGKLKRSNHVMWTIGW